MRTKVVLEVGSNWKNEDDVKRSIDFARSQGVLCKFQLWNTPKFVKRSNPNYSTYIQYEFKRDWVIKHFADDVFWTIFDLDTLWWLVLEEKITQGHYKIACLDSNYKDLIDAIARQNRPTFMSVGVYGLDSIRKAVKWYSEAGNIFNLTLMHCVVDYPTKDAMLGYFKDRVNGTRHISWGLSYNGKDPLVPALAVAIGAEAVEVHCKVRDMNTPDSPHSMDKATFKKMLANIRIAEEKLGNAERPLDCERVHIKAGKRVGGKR